MKKVLILISVLAALLSNQLVADVISGGPRVNLRTGELIVPCVEVENPGSGLDRRFFDVKLEQNGYSFDLISTEEENDDVCKQLIEASLNADKDTSDVMGNLWSSEIKSIPQLGPMNVAVKGINYQPTPSDYTTPPQNIYSDSDFFNQDFIQLWGTGTPPNQPGGRNDVGDMLSLGVNFIRVFDWNPGGPLSQPFRNHAPWLEHLAKNKIYTAGTFSNGNRATAQAQLVVDQFNSFSNEAKSQIAVWFIGNEISSTDPFTLQALEVIKNSATAPLDTIPICIPFQMSSTQDAIDKIKTNYQQQFVPQGLDNRFIACLNFYGLGYSAMDQAPEDQLNEFITRFFADPFIQSNNIKLFLTEFGINFDDSNNIEPNAGGDRTLQGKYLNNMLAKSIALQAKYPGFLGQAIFEYTNESWKTPSSEANFGLYSVIPQPLPLTGKTTRASDPAYPLDTRAPRPQHQAVVNQY